MAYKVAYKTSVERDLRKINKTEVARILDKVERGLGRDPGKGEALKGPFQALFRYRIGDYRVIYTKTKDGILVLRIGHRKDVYKQK